MGTERYIDFPYFCKLIAIFNPKYSLDEKIKCKFSKLVYFRIFDVNNDW